ncbi:MAG: hypothetical protein JWN46_3567 [Acidimicrobiales bacterium]|nr:hypothetical protein [Acidimicrobiales bacterium]
MLRRLVVVAGLAGVAGFIVKTVAPDVARYLRIREM